MCRATTWRIVPYDGRAYAPYGQSVRGSVRGSRENNKLFGRNPPFPRYDLGHARRGLAQARARRTARARTARGKRSVHTRSTRPRPRERRERRAARVGGVSARTRRGVNSAGDAPFPRGLALGSANASRVARDSIERSGLRRLDVRERERRYRRCRPRRQRPRRSRAWTRRTTRPPRPRWEMRRRRTPVRRPRRRTRSAPSAGVKT